MTYPRLDHAASVPYPASDIIITAFFGASSKHGAVLFYTLNAWPTAHAAF